jgi:small subunit ribosomal protein S4
MHGQRRGRKGDYVNQLRAKQKIRRIYGVGELQFRNIYHEADRRKGATGENLLKLLESRLDNVVYRVGLGISRGEARQLVRHKAILVNGCSVNIPSYQLEAGDEIRVSEKSLEQLRIKAALKFSEERSFPDWLDVDVKEMAAKLKQLPDVNQLPLSLQPELVVELYSK